MRLVKWAEQALLTSRLPQTYMASARPWLRSGPAPWLDLRSLPEETASHRPLQAFSFLAAVASEPDTHPQQGLGS